MKRFFTKKRIIWSVIILVILALIGYRIFKPKDVSGILTETATKQDLQQTVLATGQVTSHVDLDLNFQGTGPVAKINVAVGDQVKQGQILATLNQGDEAASLTSAQGALRAAQANYQKVLDGASSEEVAVAQAAVDSATVNAASALAQQDVLVANAYAALLNSAPQAVPSNTDSTATVMVSGRYTGTQEGTYRITVEPASGGPRYKVNGLGDISDTITRGLNMPIGSGPYVNFSQTGTLTYGTEWDIAIPNTLAPNYSSNLNTYNSAVATKNSTVAANQAAYDSAVAQLNLKKAQARPADVQAAQAQVLSAQGQAQAAQSAWEKTIIRAPAAGTITAVNIKIGEQAAGTSPAVVLQDVDNLYLEANISEANVASVQPGQDVDVTFDALGPDQHYQATVQTVDPASTVVAGVVNYKVTSSLTSTPEIKPGMTANLTIHTAAKSQALAVSSRAVISQDGKKYVRVVDNPAKKTYHEVEVTTGLEADSGLVEILSGITEGTEVVSYLPQ